MKVVPQIQEEVELALDFVDSAAAATLRMPLAEGTAVRARLTTARDALVACHAEAGILSRVHRAGRHAPLATRLRRRLRRLAWRLGPAAEPRLDLLFGQRAIARYMGLTRAQGRSILAEGRLPTFELAGVTCARRSSMRRHLRLLEGPSGA